MKAARRRSLAVWLQDVFRVSQRRACRALRLSRSSAQYQSRRPPQAPLRARLRALAGVRVSYGYRRLHVLLAREGWQVNHKRVHRLYTEEGLTLRRRRPKRHRSAVAREARPVPTVVNERWAMDFVHDTLAGGQRIRLLTVLDVYTRECLAIAADPSLRGEDVAAVLSRVAAERGTPAVIQSDNGGEFTGRTLDLWAYGNHVRLDFSRPGTPTDNAVIEAFHRRLREECLSQHWFLSLADARQTLERWREDYNNNRPHSALRNLTPVQFRTGGAFTPDRSRLRVSQV